MSVRENVYVAFGIKFPMAEFKERFGTNPKDHNDEDQTHLDIYRREREGKQLRILEMYEGSDPFVFVGKVIAHVDIYNNVTPGWTYIPHPGYSGTDKDLLLEFVEFGLNLGDITQRAGNCVFTIVN